MKPKSKDSNPAYTGKVDIYVQFLGTYNVESEDKVLIKPVEPLQMTINAADSLSDQLQNIYNKLHPPYQMEDSCLQMAYSSEYVAEGNTINDMVDNKKDIKGKLIIYLREQVSVRSQMIVNRLYAEEASDKLKKILKNLLTDFQEDTALMIYFSESDGLECLSSLASKFPKLTVNVLRIIKQIVNDSTCCNNLIDHASIVYYLYSNFEDTNNFKLLGYLFKIFSKLISNDPNSSSQLIDLMVKYDKASGFDNFGYFYSLLSNEDKDTVHNSQIILIKILRNIENCDFYSDIILSMNSMKSKEKIKASKIDDETYTKKLLELISKTNVESEKKAKKSTKKGKKVSLFGSKDNDFMKFKKFKNLGKISGDGKNSDRVGLDYCHLGEVDFSTYLHDSDDEPDFFKEKPKKGSNIVAPPIPQSIPENGVAPPPPPPPGIGAPPPPPPPGGVPPPPGLKSNTSINAKKKYIQLFWNKITDSKVTKNIKNTIWGSIIDSDLTISIDLDNFEVQATNKVIVTEKPESERMSIFDQRKIQSISIMLKKLPSINLLRTSLQDMNFQTIDHETIKQLMSMMPTDDEKIRIDIVMKNNTIELLDPSEQFVIELTKIPDIKARLEIIMLVRSFDSFEKEASESLFDLIKAIDEIKSNKLLPLILKLIYAFGAVFNTVKTKFGFRLDYIDKVTSITDTCSRTPLLYYVAEIIANEYSSMANHDLHSDFISVHSVSKLNFDSINSQYREFTTKFNNIKSILNTVIKHMSTPASVKLVNDEMSNISEKLKVFESINNRLKNRYNKTLQYYGYTLDECKTVPVHDFFGMISKFSLEYKNMVGQLRNSKEKNRSIMMRKQIMQQGSQLARPKLFDGDEKIMMPKSNMDRFSKFDNKESSVGGANFTATLLKERSNLKSVNSTNSSNPIASRNTPLSRNLGESDDSQ